MANARTVYTGQDEYKPPNLDDLFSGLNGSEPGYQPKPPPPPPPPQYGTYHEQLRNLIPTGRRMMAPLLIASLIVLVFIGGGWYMVSNMNQLPDMQMNVANSVQAATVPGPQIIDTVRVGYVGSTAEGQIIPADQAKVYEWHVMDTGEHRFLYHDIWYCAPMDYNIPALWKLSYDIEGLPGVGGFYQCEQ